MVTFKKQLFAPAGLRSPFSPGAAEPPSAPLQSLAVMVRCNVGTGGDGVNVGGGGDDLKGGSDGTINASG